MFLAPIAKIFHTASDVLRARDETLSNYHVPSFIASWGWNILQDSGLRFLEGEYLRANGAGLTGNQSGPSSKRERSIVYTRAELQTGGMG